MQPRTQPLSYRSIVRVVGVLVLAAMLLYLIYLLRQPIGWVLAAGFIAVAVSPPIRRLSKYMPRGIAITLVYLVGLVGVPLLLGSVIVPPMVDQGTALAQDMPKYANDVTQFVEKNKRLRELDAKYDITGTIETQAAGVPKRLGDAAKILTSIGFGLVSSVFALVNILILSIFMLISGRTWGDAIVRLRPEEERERLRRVFHHGARAISGYVQGAVVIGVIAGVQTFIVLSILGVPFAAPLAVMAGFASLIPLVGATIAAMIIGFVTLFTNFPTATIIWFFWSIIYQQLENNLIQPQVQKRTVHVQPIVVLIAVLFGAKLLGIVGAIIAIPFAAMVQIIIAEWWDWRAAQRKALIVNPDDPGPLDNPDLTPSSLIVPGRHEPGEEPATS